MITRPFRAFCLWAFLGLVGLAAIGPATGRALGMEARFLEPAARSVLAVGDVVEVRWTGAPVAEEVELLLSVDGGKSFPVRLTRELEGNATVYRWRVPGLISPEARLALRAKVGGQELQVGSSAPFAIVAAPTSPSIGSSGSFGSFGGAIETVRGELWWVDRAIAGSSTDLPLAGLERSPDEPAVHAAGSGPFVADLSVRPGAPRPAEVSTLDRPERAAAGPSEATSRVWTLAPLHLPLRI